jgi:hypothetical protein
MPAARHTETARALQFRPDDETRVARANGRRVAAVRMIFALVGIDRVLEIVDDDPASPDVALSRRLTPTFSPSSPGRCRA